MIFQRRYDVKGTAGHRTFFLDQKETNMKKEKTGANTAAEKALREIPIELMAQIEEQINTVKSRKTNPDKTYKRSINETSASKEGIIE